MSAGKGDKPRPVDMDKAVIYCEHNRFRDKCTKCKEINNAKPATKI